MNINKSRSLGVIKCHDHEHQYGEHCNHNHLRDDQVLAGVAQMRAKALLVLGPLGSGKTSLVKWLLSKNGRVLGKLRLIINDVGTENIDAGRLAEDVDLAAGDVAALQSGCICCEDLDSLMDEVTRVGNELDTIVIEPTGIAEGDTIATSLQKIGVRSQIVTLIDVLHHERRTAAERQVIDTQVAVAKVIGLTWWEKASEEQMEAVLNYIGGKNAEAPIVKLPKLPFGETEILGDGGQPEYDQLFDLMMDETPHASDDYSHVEHSHRHDEHGHDSHSHEHQHAHQEHSHAPVFSKSFVDIAEGFSAVDLEKLLARYERVLIRAKGVVDGQRFNYVHGSLNWEKASSDAAVINFITSEAVDDEGIGYLLKVSGRAEKSEIASAYLLQLDQKINQYLTMNKEQMLEFSEQEVNKLLGQYQEWNDLAGQILALKAVKPASVANEQRIEAMQLKQKELGEAMIFANPLVWLKYKIRAYADSPKALRNLEDLRKHCASATDICYKRLNYLNGVLTSKYSQNLLDESSVAGKKSLLEIADEEQILSLCLDSEFMKKWQECEYFRQADASGRMRVAKWENYQRANS